jgi:polyisoprenoid-binding protein YceI
MNVVAIIAWALPAWFAIHVEPRTYRIVEGLSQASYAVDEVFLLENNRLFTAVGVTSAVSGTIVADPSRPGDTRIEEISVDLRQLKSDSDRRDRALREKYLATDRFPFARVTRAVLHDLPASIVAGRAFRYTLSADLTVHGTTKPTRWQGEAIVAGDTVRGVARTQVKMSVFGIEVPRLLSLRSADDVKLEIKFVAVASPNPSLP